MNSFSGRVDERSFTICSGEMNLRLFCLERFTCVVPAWHCQVGSNCTCFENCFVPGWVKHNVQTVFWKWKHQVGSNTLLVDPTTGVEYRGREYPWGVVNIEDQVMMMMMVVEMMMVMVMVMVMMTFSGQISLNLECLKVSLWLHISYKKEFYISSNSDIFQDHCDFMPLRNLVLAHHMQDLKDVSLSSSSSS